MIEGGHLRSSFESENQHGQGTVRRPPLLSILPLGRCCQHRSSADLGASRLRGGCRDRFSIAGMPFSQPEPPRTKALIHDGSRVIDGPEIVLGAVFARTTRREVNPPVVGHYRDFLNHEPLVQLTQESRLTTP